MHSESIGRILGGSFIAGELAAQLDAEIDPAYVALFASRGFESAAHKQFMRLTVLVSDVAVYFTAVGYYVLRGAGSRRGPVAAAVLAALLLLLPPLVVIDHGRSSLQPLSVTRRTLS